MKEWESTGLPLQVDVESITVLKKVNTANRALARLDAMARSLPSQNTLLNNIVLREAKASSTIENILTTHDDLYKADVEIQTKVSSDTKEVQNYKEALYIGYRQLVKKELLTNNIILDIQATLERNDAGFRKQPGTKITNAATDEVVHFPPQDIKTILHLMTDLESYINTNSACDLDPLIKMAIIHYQFESIHPFYDGNGRTGRIINVLYLVLQHYLNAPILYLSGYIVKHKDEYYKRLSGVTENNDWEGWIMYMLDAVENSATDTIKLVSSINGLMQTAKEEMRTNYNFYSQDLLNAIFLSPYTKIDRVKDAIGVSRQTAATYLNRLAEDGLLMKGKYGKHNYYINMPLYNILSKA